MENKSDTARSEPMVSVVIGTYQHASYIRECLDSVLAQQTDFLFEVIIGEDDSDDGTREICTAYELQFPDRIRLFLRSRKDVIFINGKATGRFNFVENMKAAKGKYIALLDGDDYWSDVKKLQKQVDFLETNPDCVACHHWQSYAVPTENGFVVHPAPTVGEGFLPDPKSGVREIFSNRLRLKSRTIMFRNVLKDYPDWFFKVAYGDVPLTMLLGQYGDFGFLNENMAVYRQTGKGVSSHGSESHLFGFTHFLEWIRVWEFANNHFEGKYWKEAAATILYFYTLIFGKYQYSFQIFRKCAKYALMESQLSFIQRIHFFRKISATWLSGRMKRKTGK